MQTFQWQDNNSDFEEENTESQSEFKGMTIEENKESIQLKKYQDPSKDEQRQSILSLTQRFGDLFTHGNFSNIAKDLLADDFEIFIFNSTRQACVRTANQPQGFIETFKDVKIYERRVREINIDSEKATACQICNYKISYEADGIPIDEIACEIFSIRDGKISKYRASFGNPTLDDPAQDPLEPTRKDKMLAKIKQINYALAEGPDLEKIKSLLDENVEFKIWRWDDFKCFTLYKNDFVSSFKELQTNLSIRYVVPYEFYTDPEGKYVNATYIYHLEDNKSGKRYDWLSTCIYGFDINVNITKVSQQGELYPEGEVDVPFEVHTREKLEKKIHGFISPDVWNMDSNFLDSNCFLYDCMIWSICFACPPGTRCFQGNKQVTRLVEKKEMFKRSKAELIKTIDIYIDHHNESYDTLFAIAIAQGTGLGFGGTNGENEGPSNVIMLLRGSFENGKLAKSCFFVSRIIEPIDSPFDDKAFHCLNIK